MICPTCNGSGTLPDPILKPGPRRLTQAAPGSWFSPEYSSVCPVSVDNEKVVVINVDHYAMFNRSEFEFHLLIPANAEFRWSPLWEFRQFAIYYAPNPVDGRRNALRGYDASAHVSFPVYTFDEFEHVWSGGECDISDDGEHLAVIGDRKEIFLFNHKEKRSYGRFFPDRKIDGLKLTHDNRILVSGGNGIELYDPFENTVRGITWVNGHADVAYWQGRDYLVWTNAAEHQPRDPDAIERIDLESGNRITLMELSPPWKFVPNISCPHDTGWCAVSTVSRDLSLVGEIYKVWLDGSGFETIVKHGSKMDGATDKENYLRQPRVSVSRDGSRLVYGSNVSGNVETYLLEGV